MLTQAKFTLPRVGDKNTIKGLKELADLLGVTIQTAHKYKKRGVFPFYQVSPGGTVYFKKDEVISCIRKGGHQ